MIRLRCWRPQAASLLATVVSVLLLISVLTPRPAAADGEVWRQLAIGGPTPTPRSGAAAIRDSHGERLIVFGGRLATGDLTAAVWMLNLTPLSETWTRAPLGAGPEARYGHTMIYDAVNQRAVVFGGTGADRMFDDAWALELDGDGPRWTLFPPVPGPGARSEHSAIYDARNQRMVVYGGRGLDGNPTDEVWVLDLRAGHGDWRLLSPPVVGTVLQKEETDEPPVRYGHTAVYDPVNQQMVVFGGMGPDGHVHDDVWLLSLRAGNEAWKRLALTGGPHPRAGHSAVYDTRNRRMLIYGGLRDDSGVASDVWALYLTPGGEHWKRLAASGGQVARSDTAFVYDERDQRAVVFGGETPDAHIAGSTYALELTLDAPPDIRIVEPEHDGIVNSTSVTVQVVIDNFILDPYRVGRGPDRVAFGSWHLLVDGVVTGAQQETESLGVQLRGLTAGEHVIKAELLSNRDAPIGVEDVKVITVRPGWPAIRILSPGDDERTYQHDVVVSVAVENIQLGGATRGESQYRGYWRIALDGQWRDEQLTGTTYTLEGVPRGDHQIEVELRTDDGAPFEPAITDHVVVHVLEPSIHIVSPLNESLINSSSVEVRIEVEDFTLDPDRVGGPNETGFGHWHLLLDGAYQTFVTGTRGLAATLTELTPGPHVITVELANNDHTLLGIRDSVDIVIADGRPAIGFVSPTPNALVRGPDVEVRVRVENFILDGENIGGDPVPGHGHWHLFVDGMFQVQTAEPAATARLPSPGLHRITVTLSNNDHTSLDPPVIDTIVVLWPYRYDLPLIQR